MSLSRRQRSVLNAAAGEQQLVGDNLPPPTYDGMKLTSPPPTPPPPPLQRFRSSNGQAATTAAPNFLRQVWPCPSSVLRPPAGEAAGNSTAFFAPSEHGRAPVSADTIGALDGRKQGCGRWVRLKGVGSRVSLIIVVGALLFDVYLLKVAFSGARGKHLPNGGGSFSGKPLSSGWTQGVVSGNGKGDDRDASIAGTWSTRPTEPSRVPPEEEGSGTWAGTLRSFWSRVTAIGNSSPTSEGDTPKTGAEWDPVSHRTQTSEGFLSRFIGRSLERKPKISGQQLLVTDNAALNNEDSFPGLTSEKAHVPRPLPQPRPSQSRLDPYDGQRVAVVVPYVGTELPVWWEAFAEQARFNDGLVDWIIFCDKKLVREGGPPNIKFFPMDTRRMAWLLAGVVEVDMEGLRGGTVPFPAQGGRADGGFEDQVLTSERDKALALDPTRLTMRETLAKNLATRKRAASFLHQVLLMSPYYIVEFKPALGWLFREYLGEYTHWAYGDLDVLFGDMRNGWLQPEELKRFDIITFSFGDQYRAYLRGQLTIHKNEFKVNRVWRGCSHLINYSDRLEAFRANRALPLESAEGCYSRAAALDASLKIKFTVKALSDVDEEGESGSKRGREVIIDGHGLVTLCPDLGYYDGPAGARRNYGAASPGPNDGPSPSMQDAVGPITAVKRLDASEGRCEHWIKPEHQTCVENVGGSHTLFLLGGEYYKQEFINTATATGGRDCRAGAFYHFQAHKLNFRVWNSLPPVPRAHFGVAAGPGGIVPLPAAGWRESVSGPGLQPPAAHTQKAKKYCLAWIERRTGRSADGSHPEQVCAVTVSGSEAVAIVDTRPVPPTSAGTIATKNAKTITLGSVGHPSHIPSFLSNAGEWEGPKIFAMALDSEELAATREMAILNRVKYIRGGVLIVALLRPPPNVDMPKLSPTFPENALMNLVSDLCESRYLLTLPGLSRLSPSAFQTVFTQLHHRSPRTPASKRPEGSRSNVPGPVTLVVPYDVPTPPIGRRGYGSNVGGSSSALSVSVAAAAAAAASAHKAAALVLEQAWADLAASKTAEAAAEGAMNAAAKAAAEVASAVRDGGGRFRLRPSDDEDDDHVVNTVGGGDGGSDNSGVGGSDSGGGGPGRQPHSVESETVAAAAELVPLQISFGTAAGAGRADSDAKGTEGSRVRKTFRKRGDVAQRDGRGSSPPQQGDVFSRHRGGTPAAPPPSGREEVGAKSAPSEIRASRRLDVLGASGGGGGSSGEGAGKGAGWSSGSREAIEWDVDGLEVTEWLRESLLSGPGMPGLVVDLWSPGALFLRRVEEFGGSGCMDAAYALGLWRAGSSFLVVEGATLTLTDPTLSSQGDSYSGAQADSDSGHVFHVPGGACLLREAVAKTASIYSTFLGQVANVYRHPRSEIAGQHPRRAYKDHWDYMPDESETTSAKPWAASDPDSLPYSHVRPPATGVLGDDDIINNRRGGGSGGGGGGDGGVRGRTAGDHP